MSEWREYKLGEICSLITDGKHGDCKDQLNSGYYFISAKDVKDGKIVYTNSRQITKEDFEETHRRTNFSVGNIVITNSGTIGRMAIGQDIPETIRTTFQKSVAVLKPIKETVSSKFLYYRLLSKYRLLFDLAGGTTQQNLLLGDLREFEITLPEKNEQHAIASILSSLDDKIDLLHRQNKTLEALAETLFRQWFVEEADESWEQVKLSTLGKIICGKTPSKKIVEYFGGDVPFIKIPDMHGKTFVFDSEDSLTEFGMNSQLNKTIPPKSICVSCIATVGLVVMNAKTSQTNQQINSIIPYQDHFRYYIYLKMITLKDELLGMASGGTATDNLNTGDFSKIDIQLPEEKNLLAFHKMVEPMFDKIFQNQTQTQTLTRLRDALLPKLMSGEIRLNCDSYD